MAAKCPSGVLVRSRRRVAMVDGQGVAVRVVEEALMADAGIEGVAFELDAARFQLRLGGLEIVDVELDREIVGAELDVESVHLHQGDRQVPGLELARGHAPPALRELEAQRLAVEPGGPLVVLRRHGDEVGAAYDLGLSCHLAPSVGFPIARLTLHANRRRTGRWAPQVRERMTTRAP